MDESIAGKRYFVSFIFLGAVLSTSKSEVLMLIRNLLIQRFSSRLRDASECKVAHAQVVIKLLLDAHTADTAVI